MSITFMTKKVLPGVAVAFAFAVIPSLAAAGQDAAQIKRGAGVYTAQKCQACHIVAGTGNKANPLDGVGAKLTSDQIREWLIHPKEMATKTQSKGKPPMPDKYMKLPPADLDALVAYLQSLK